MKTIYIDQEFELPVKILDQIKTIAKENNTSKDEKERVK